MNYEIKDENQKFILIENQKEIGYLQYSKDTENDFIIEAIFVQEEYRGDGYAKIIFNKFIEKVKQKERKIIPICSYACSQFQKRKEIQELLKK